MAQGDSNSETNPDEQPSPRDGLRAVWRFSAGERGAFLGATLALFGSALCLYLVP
ncbi:MAG: hypothetical protein RLZZ217_1112, partial [Planctomycetota bacterium]